MFPHPVYLVAILLACFNDYVSASSETVTGPVTFLWPEQRPWYAAWQTNGPCGINDGSVGNRTEFPLGSGKVSLVVAGDTWDVQIRMAYMNEPTTQSDFTNQIIHTISEIEAGHECYTTPDSPSNIVAGSNATIQLEYTSTYAGSANETFYACADITFVESDFTTSVSCFNVSISDPSTEGIATSTSSLATATATSSSSSSTTPSSTSSHSSGLSSGARAGVAVGCIIGGLALLGAAVMVLRKKYGYKPTFRNREAVDHEAVKMKRLSDENALSKRT